MAILPQLGHELGHLHAALGIDRVCDSRSLCRWDFFVGLTSLCLVIARWRRESDIGAADEASSPSDRVSLFASPWRVILA